MERVEAGAAAGQAVLELEIASGPWGGQRLSLHEDFRIGSAEEGPGALGDRWLSPSHALIHRGPEGWAVEDLRSLEGTRVNGRPVRGAVTLAAGDTIELGSTRIAVVPDGHEALAELPDSQAKARADELRSVDFRRFSNRRVLAAIVDWAILYVLFRATVSFTGGRLAALVAAAAIQLTYYFLSESLAGQTLGGRIFRIRVVRLDGTPLRPQSVAARTVLRLIDSSIIGLICLLATGRRRQRLGDLAAGTVVIGADYTPPRAPLVGRNRLALLAYPPTWLAPALVLFMLVPSARYLSCRDAGISTRAGREGTCVTGGRVEHVVDGGHTLRMQGMNVDLTGSSVRDRAGLAIVSLDLRVRNTSDRPLDLSSAGAYLALNASSADARRVQFVREAPAALRSRRHSLQDLKLAPGATATGRVSFALPPSLVPMTLDSDLVLAPRDVASRDVGDIRLWRYATVEGARAMKPVDNY